MTKSKNVRPRSLPLSKLAVMLAATIIGSIASAIACNSQPALSGAGDSGPLGTTFVGCGTPNDGCPCAPGEIADCGEVQRKVGDYAICMMGQRTCSSGGTWGACQGNAVTTKSLTTQSKMAPIADDAFGVHTQAVPGTQMPCVAANACDPYCNQTTDDPSSGFTPPSGFTLTDGGLTLVPEAGVDAGLCTIGISPANPTVTVTSIRANNTITTSPVAPFTGSFSLTMTPGCSGPAVPVWTLDAPDTATITPVAGLLTVVNPIIRVFHVTVYAYGQSATTTVTVQVNATDGTANPNASIFSNATSGIDVTKILYPYSNSFNSTFASPTVFPTGLPGPVVQWDNSSYVANQTVMVTLRYVPGSGPTFIWRGYVADHNPGKFSAATVANVAETQVNHAFPVPLAWSSFEQSAKGNVAEIDVQRLHAGNTLAYPQKTIPIKFASASLKGAVYYQSYTSALAGNVGAVLAIKPGSSTPSVVTTSGFGGDNPSGSAPSGNCHVCHSISADGSTLVSALNNYSSSAFFQLSNGTATWTRTDSASNKKWNWVALYPDGSFGLSSSNAGVSTYGSSSLWKSSDSSAIASNFPAAAKAVMPAFSPDGRKVAFSYARGPALNANPVNSVVATGLSTCSGAGSPDNCSLGKNIVVMDFNCNRPGAAVTCGAAAPAWSFSNARNVYDGAVPLNGEPNSPVVWNSFLPDSSGVVFERKVRLAAGTSTWAENPDTRWGAMGELWISDVPPDNTAANKAKPIPLKLANGFDSSGTSYLSQTSAAQGAGHINGSTVAWEGSDTSCAPGGSGAGTDANYNYMPTVNPGATGGYNWVVFMSRRMYGNTINSGPWGCEPSTDQTLKEEKLWVTALDQSWTPGTDPSHPAFYLPSQELASGAERAFWALSTCAAAGNGPTNTCSTTSDCCSPNVCSVDVDAVGNPILPVTSHCKAPVACSPTAGSCSSASDCCDASEVCSGGLCTFPNPAPTFANGTFSTDFSASCTTGYQVTWQLLQFIDSVPAGTSLGFRVASANTAAALSTATPHTLGTSPPPGSSAWGDVGQTTDAALIAGGDSSRAFLRLYIDFNVSAMVATTLYQWRQLFDCVPSQ